MRAGVFIKERLCSLSCVAWVNLRNQVHIFKELIHLDLFRGFFTYCKKIHNCSCTLPDIDLCGGNNSGFEDGTTFQGRLGGRKLGDSALILGWLFLLGNRAEQGNSVHLWLLFQT